MPQIVGFLGFWLVIFTAVVFCVAIFWVHYTCIHVVATLAAVESSNPTTYIRLDSEDPNGLREDDEAISNAKPITRGLRPAINHLRDRGGIWSYCRGFRMYLACTGFDMGVGYLVRVIVILPLYSLTGVSVVGAFLGEFGARMLLATWEMAWVHLVIADKSPRSNYRRMLGLQHWRRIAPAAAVYNLVMCAVFAVPTAYTGSFGWAIVVLSLMSPGNAEFLPLLVVNIVPSLIFPLLSIPARGIFIRVAASMLPEEDEPIVPFDRSFGGKAKPEIIAGSSKLSLKDAWATFGQAARIRYLKVILKALAIEAALVVAGVLLVMGELALFS